MTNWIRVVLLAWTVWLPFHQGLDPHRLSSHEIRIVNSLLKRLEVVMEQKRSEGTLPTLIYEELFQPLSRREKKFLRRLQSIKPAELGIRTPFLGLADPIPGLVRLDEEGIGKNGRPFSLSPQYLPRKVYKPYLKMMKAMKKQIGRRLYVESGFRSSAYQLYLFVYYLTTHDFSIRETARWNAFPGYSEHGCPEKQAIDFINEQGVSGEERPEEFEKLPEFRWLVEHAHEYGFYLSYPRDNPWGIGFEPWHWHFEKKA